MALLVVFVLATALVSKVTLEEVIEPAVNPTSNEKENSFEQKLNQHISILENDYKPFTELLESKGCRTNRDKRSLSSIHFDSKINVESCVNLTSAIAAAQRLLIDSYRLPLKYKALTLEFLKNSTECYSNDDAVIASICAIGSFNSYGALYGGLNEELKEMLLEEKELKKGIFDYYKGCFGLKTTELHTVAQDYADKLC